MALLPPHRDDTRAYGPIPSNGGYAYINTNTLGVPLSQVSTMQIQCTQPFTVEVIGPMGRVQQAAVYSPYPGPGAAGGNANEIVIIRGHWQGLRVATQGEVFVGVDGQDTSYGGF